MASHEEKRGEAGVDSPPDGRPSSTTNQDMDMAIKLVGEHAQEIDPQMERRVLRKIDLFLIPAMIVGLCLTIGAGINPTVI